MLSSLPAVITPDLNPVTTVKFLAVFLSGALLLGLAAHMAAARRSSLNHGVSSAMGILMIYCVTVLVVSFQWEGLEALLSPLPFVRISGDRLFLFSFADASWMELARQLLSMLILALLVNLLDSWIPQGAGIFRWYGLRLLTVLLAMVLHLAVMWLFRSFLPASVTAWAPVILLGILALFFFLGLLGLLLSLLLTAANPFLGLFSAFFFGKPGGKLVSGAILTTAILCGVVALLNLLGVTVLPISPQILPQYLPALVIILGLWFLFGRIL